MLTFEREGIALGLMALLPGLLYTALKWVLAWMLGKMSIHASRPVRAVLLACVTIGLLLVVHLPVYVVGGHGPSSSSDLFTLFGDAIGQTVVLRYWIALHAVLASLFVGALLRDHNAFIAHPVRWGA